MTSDQIFKQLGIEGSDGAFKAEMLSKIMATTDLRFARALDEIMNDEERQEFEAFSEGKGPQEIAKWVERKYEDIDELYNAILESLVNDLAHKGSQV